MGTPLPNVLESFMSLLSGPHFVFQGIKKKLEMKFIPTILWLHGRLLSRPCKVKNVITSDLW